jgi:SAM-dependent methyltransferase
MRRLAVRRLRLRSRDYLVYRSLWPAIERAVAAALKNLDMGTPVVVDVGCGERPYASLFGTAQLIGVDRSIDGAAPDVIADASALPLADACADMVFCAQVIEHVPEPHRLVAECHRLLASGGWLVMSGPFWWPLHEEPHDYFRFTHHGFDSLLRRVGFEEISVQPDSGSLTQLALALIELLPRWALPLVPIVNLVTPALQRFSRDRRSGVNLVALARKP